jgi:uncharacterized protein (DUF433 family)
MNTTIEISPEAFELLQRRAKETRSSPEQLAETVIRLHLGNTVHIEQKQTRSGSQAYLRGTRIAVRHVAAFLRANHTVEEIIRSDLPNVSPAAVYEAVAYYYDHQAEIEAELAANAKDTVLSQLRETLPAEQYTQLTGQTA